MFNYKYKQYKNKDRETNNRYSTDAKVNESLKRNEKADNESIKKMIAEEESKMSMKQK